MVLQPHIVAFKRSLLALLGTSAAFKCSGSEMIPTKLDAVVYEDFLLCVCVVFHPRDQSVQLLFCESKAELKKENVVSHQRGMLNDVFIHLHL